MPSYRSLASSTVVINPGNEDRISQLSDDVLCSILSYLTTKEVVATSVLSKRWKYVWASSQELTIESACNRSLSHLICRLFACRTLVKLTIKGRFVVDIPTSAACTTFPCLKILSLEGVVYSNHISAQKLFSSCHVLEDLTICRHKCDGLRVLIICVPPLKRLAITSSIRGGDNLKVKIDCPCVQYFEFHGKSEIKFIANLSSLVEAHIYGKCGFDLFKKISHVEFLALSDKAVRGLSWSNPKNFLLTFNKLVKLELLGDYFYWKSLPQLLERSPNLEVLVFPKGFVVLRDIWYGYPGFYWNEPDSVPQCLISHLKKIRIQNFVGLPDEIQFLKYVLKFGEALETVEIRCANVDEKWLMMKADEGLKNVARCEKASRSCAIAVHFPN